MKKLLLLTLLCTACAPASSNGGNAAEPAAPSYGTQTKAPTPDYRALLAEPASGGEAWQQREATAPPPAAAKAVGETWVNRLKERGALLGVGMAGKGPDGPVNLIDTGLTRAEFEGWAKDNDWTIPAHIRWSFVPKFSLPPVSEAAKEAVRFWPASTTRTGVQHQALLQGRVELRDGCFFVGEFGQPADKLAWFHAEVGLDRDQSNYFILRERVGGRTLARLGEEMSWGGPASADIDKAAERALHEVCGPGEIYVVGSPESSERFLTQYPHLRQPAAPPPPPTKNSPQ